MQTKSTRNKGLLRVLFSILSVVSLGFRVPIASRHFFIHLFSAENMEMEVKNRLPCVGAAV